MKIIYYLNAKCMRLRETSFICNTINCKLKIDLSYSEAHEWRTQEIFYSENLGVINALGKFIKNALQKRESTICHILLLQYVYYQTIVT